MKFFRKIVNRLHIVTRQMKYKPRIKPGISAIDWIEPKKHEQDFVNKPKKD